MKAEIIPDWLVTGNIWQIICGLATEGGERAAGTGGGGGVLTTWAGAGLMSEQGLEGLACSGLEAGDAGAA